MGVQLDMMREGRVGERTVHLSDYHMTDDIIEEAFRASRIERILTAAGTINTRLLQRLYGTGRWRLLHKTFGSLSGLAPVTKSAKAAFATENARQDAERAKREGHGKTVKPRKAAVIDPRNVEEYILGLVRALDSGAVDQTVKREIKRLFGKIRRDAERLRAEAHRAYEKARMTHDSEFTSTGTRKQRVQWAQR